MCNVMKFPYLIIIFFLFQLPLNGQFHVLDILGDEEEVKIPFEYEQGFIILKVYLSGVLPLNFIFDTGAENTVLFEREYADLLGITYDSQVNIIGSDRKTTTLGYISRRVDLGFVRGNDFTIDIIVLEKNNIDFKNIIGRNIDGLIGGNMLFGAILELDYKKQIITLRAAQTWTPPKSFHQEKLEIIKQRPYIKSTIKVNENSKETDINLLLDTGAAIHVMIDEDSHPSLIMPDSLSDGRIGQGLGGNVGGFIGNINGISLMDTEFQNSSVYFQKADSILYETNSVTNYRNGLVGNIFLSRYKVIIDYAHQELYTKKIRKKNKPFRFNKSGLTIFAVGPYLDEFVVKHVVPGSAGDIAGIKAGDVIKNINNLPYQFISLANINQILSRKEGKIVKLKVQRNGKLLKKNFVLRNNFILKKELFD